MKTEGLVYDIEIVRSRFVAFASADLYAKRVFVRNEAGYEAAVHIPSAHEIGIGDTVWWDNDFVHVRRIGSQASYRSIRLGRLVSEAA